MAVNVTTDLTRRQYYATNGNFPPCPGWFKHAQLGGKPSAPSTTGLSSDELDLFNQWLAKREYGTIEPQLQSAVDQVSNVKAMTITYEAYYLGANFVNWSHDDILFREMQWRLRCADILDTTEVAAVIPVSADPTGAGDNDGVGAGIPASAN